MRYKTKMFSLMRSTYIKLTKENAEKSLLNLEIAVNIGKHRIYLS